MMEKFMRVPIDPEGAGKLPREYRVGAEFPEEYDNVPTGQVSIRGNVFVALRELAVMLATATEWNKKARIVLEYDPRQEKAKVTAFMERGEAVSPWNREGNPG